MKLLVLLCAIGAAVAYDVLDQSYQFALDPNNPSHLGVANHPLSRLNAFPFANTRKVEIFNPQTEQRVRQLELYNDRIRKERVIPRCLSPFTGRMRNLIRLHDSTENEFFHSSNRSDLTHAQTYGDFLTTETSLGQISMDGYQASCECLIPLYKRQYDGYRYRWDYRTNMLSDYRYQKDFGNGNQENLNNWSLEGWCVPHRGQCGANVQLVRFTPPKYIPNTSNNLILATTTNDRTRFGETRGWTEQTLCYMWE